METTEGAKAVDVIVVVDTTGSMDSYLISLGRFIPQLLALRAITSKIRRIGVLAYNDYYMPPPNMFAQSAIVNPIPANDRAAKALIPKVTIDDVVSWSGWDEGESVLSRLTEWVGGLKAEGGGDYPEAAKTALRRVLDIVEADRADSTPEERETLVLWYTDSPPHHRSHRSVNRLLEIAAHSPPSNEPVDTSPFGLNKPTPMPPDAPNEKCIDWFHLSLRSAAANLKVYTILPPSMPDADAAFWVMLGRITRGSTLVIGGPERGTPEDKVEIVFSTSGGGKFIRAVTDLSMTIVTERLGIGYVGYMGKSKSKGKQRDTSGSGNAEKSESAIRMLYYYYDILDHIPASENDKPKIPPARDRVKKEVDAPPGMITNEDAGSQGFLPPPWRGANPDRGGTPLNAILRIGVSDEELCESLVGKERMLNARQLPAEDHVSQEGDAYAKKYDDETDAFREKVEGSLRGVVNADIEAVPSFWVFSDIWKAARKRDANSSRELLFAQYEAQIERIKDVEKKEELISWGNINHDFSSEINKLLSEESTTQESGTAVVLTLEKAAQADLGLKKEDITALARGHDKTVMKKMGYMLRYTKVISARDAASGKKTRSIPISTSSPSTLFRIIPHLIQEGLLYSSRTAAILAMVAYTSHIPHLLQPAMSLLESTKGSWLDVTIPENFATPFIGFMLSVPSRDFTLSSEEKDLYSAMVRYAYLEENLDTKVKAQVPWTPMKTRGVGDRKRLCDGCGIRRSETMMHQVGTYEYKKKDAHSGDGMRCGMCVDSDTKNPEDWKDRGEIESCWVECSERWCRAQYVIEDEEGLRIPPRCYYCRKRKPCPWIECTVCANRIILPKSYRVLPEDSVSSFICPPCRNREFTGHQTIVHKLTTLRSILFANDYEVKWLGIKPFNEVFRGRSTFMIWELYGAEIFSAAMSSPTLPPSPASNHGKTKRLLINGKKLLDPNAVKEELDAVVDRAMKKGMVLCGMTYEYILQSDVVKACSKDDCEFRASKKGLDEWYQGGTARRKLCPSCCR
ncbi:hypothetical protein CPB86DRAFT_764184 [Serendipita vermifera]|nr:hypothetical protein CPB86DRAFT_764184 [Serendipita vermifera]